MIVPIITDSVFGGDRRPLAAGLVAYYRFAGNGDDSSGRGQNAVLDEDTFAAGKLGDGLAGGSGDSGAITSTAPFTLSFWFKAVSGITDGQTGFSVTPRRAGGSLGLIQASGSGGGIVVSAAVNCPQVAKNDAWHHIAYTRSGTTFAVYQDGALVGSASGSALGLVLVQMTASGDVQMPIDELGIWSRTLTAAQVTTLYNGGAGLDPSA